jgi:hypothetical protein
VQRDAVLGQVEVEKVGAHGMPLPYHESHPVCDSFAARLPGHPFSISVSMQTSSVALRIDLPEWPGCWCGGPFCS